MMAVYTFDDRRLKAIGVPGALANVLLSGLLEERRSVVLDAVRFASEPTALRVYAGPTQVGKSMAAAVAAHHARKAGKRATALMPCEGPEEDGTIHRAPDGGWLREMPVIIGGGPLAARWVHAPAAYHAAYDREFWREVEDVSLLVLDDLGTEPQDERVRASILGLLVGRYDSGRPTIVTTNLTQGRMNQQYGAPPGDRFVARMNAPGVWHNVVVRRRRFDEEEERA